MFMDSVVNLIILLYLFTCVIAVTHVARVTHYTRVSVE